MHDILNAPLPFLCPSEKPPDSEKDVSFLVSDRMKGVLFIFFPHNYPRVTSEWTFACRTGSQDRGSIWRRGCGQSINTEAVAARNTCTEPTDESQASNDKQIRTGYTEMEPADVFTVRFQT